MINPLPFIVREQWRISPFEATLKLFGFLHFPVLIPGKIPLMILKKTRQPPVEPTGLVRLCIVDFG
ncbi:MAG: hypothetical protein QF927_00635 [Verrucomicrobiota bacterium]|jgi:hypothetical protein|nr:hypothetical protein [Verrucomicrobiota bacterium]MDP7012463.1 hypothetical protein [Verrucomicrobiota bacterium]